jgi:hypothetical protein
MHKKKYKHNSIKWIARILSIISIGIIALFVIGNGFTPLFKNIFDLLIFIFFPTCVVLGMFIAWFDELEGSLFSILSLIIFYILFYICRGNIPKGPWFAIFTFPAFIFLIFSILNIKIIIQNFKSKKSKK